MQAIRSKYFGPTATKGSRIQVSCSAGQKMFDCYDLLDSVRNGDNDMIHDEACRRFKQWLANKKGLHNWNRPTISGYIARHGEYVHVFLSEGN